MNNMQRILIAVVIGLVLAASPFWIKVKYEDLNQSLHEETIFGPRAVVLQQELDHISGILLKDKGVRIL